MLFALQGSTWFSARHSSLPSISCWLSLCCYLLQKVAKEKSQDGIDTKSILFDHRNKGRS
jgi:hypothetical protein